MSEAKKPLLVGELNPYGADPDFALYPLPARASGDRLCRLVMGLRRGQYLAAFDRVNLCTGKWSAPAARKRADELCADDERQLFVLLGVKVSAAFLPGKPKAFTIEQRCAGTFVVLPHPSGLCRVWDEPGSVERARKLLTEAGVLPIPAELPEDLSSWNEEGLP